MFRAVRSLLDIGILLIARFHAHDEPDAFLRDGKTVKISGKLRKLKMIRKMKDIRETTNSFYSLITINTNDIQTTNTK